MKRTPHLPPYILIGSRVAEVGERLLIDDKFKEGDRALCLLHDETSGALLLCVVDGILNLDGSTVLVLGSSDPEDLESEYQSYFAVRFLPPNAIEILDEKLIDSIQEAVQESIGLDRKENLARVESIFGTLRTFERGKETVPFSKNAGST